MMRGAARDNGAAGGVSGGGSPDAVELRLYLADDAPASRDALKNVRAALDEIPPERYVLKIIDAYDFPDAAVSDGVVLTPALVRVTSPRCVVVGTFADPRQIHDVVDGALCAAGLSGEVTAQVLETARTVNAAKRGLQETLGGGVDMVLAPEEFPVLLPAAQGAVREKAQHFRRIFEEAPLGMALLSDSFRFLRINHRLSSLAGYPPCELLAMGLSDLTGEEGRGVWELNLTGSRSCETGFCEGETQFTTRSGEMLWLRLSLALVRHETGGRGYFLLIVQDVTGMKRAEAELLCYHSQLETLVRERTEELAATNRKLMKEIEERLEAEDAARALNEELEIRVRERTAELEQSNTQLETMNRFFVGRELRMAELKGEIEKLKDEVRALKQGEK